MWMGLAPLPSQLLGKERYAFFIYSKIYETKRFELLLRSFHLSNNEECPTGDRLFKVQGLIDLLVSKYKSAYFQKRIYVLMSLSYLLLVDSFRQYVKNKHHIWYKSF